MAVSVAVVRAIPVSIPFGLAPDYLHWFKEIGKFGTISVVTF
jgi:hypothetical protein